MDTDRRSKEIQIILFPMYSLECVPKKIINSAMISVADKEN
ncbi:MAG: hypothetical protein Q8862_11380 [Bacteroidota bacterium]|nr:hypothetical protein [Bacteroidota bacterium]